MQPAQYIIGHRNPDADAICSAIAYADLKARRGESGWGAARCGNSNARIDAILDAFQLPLPEFVGDVTPRVRDVMIRDIIKARPEQTIAEALELIEGNDIRALPVTDPEDKLLGMVTVFQLGRHFVPQVKELRQMRMVRSSIAAIARSLKARVLNLARGEAVEQLFVRIAAMDIRSFNRFPQNESIEPEHSIVIVGDRWDIQQRSIQLGIRLIVVTGGLDVDEDVVEQARARGVSLIVSPYDSATSAWIVRTATTLENLVEDKVTSFGPEETVAEARRRATNASLPTFAVVDDERRLLGVFSKSDLLRPVSKKLILVDHNEISQAVPGAAEVQICEIIDHHRLGSLQTPQPILFINEPVGSTCTIIADLFRRDGIEPSAAIAGVMMGGIISDTLHLNSPTSTERDNAALAWLSRIAGMESRRLAERIFNAGSVLLSLTPAQVVRADMKVYQEEGVRFAVAQVEELGMGNFWARQEQLAGELESLRREDGLQFACLLVTDIHTQNSVLLVQGSADIINRIPYTALETGKTFDLPGVVSRKKQLVPFLTTLLKENRGDTRTPFTQPAARG